MLTPRVAMDFIVMVSSILGCLGLLFGISSFVDLGLIERGSMMSILSMLAPAMQMSQLVAPFPIVLDAVRRQDVQNLPLPVIKSQAICNVLGAAYGVQVVNSVVLFTNMFGLGCQTVYLAGDHFVRSKNEGWVRFALEKGALFNLGLFVCAAVLPVNILGYGIILFNIVLFAAPLTKLPVILNTRDASSLPLSMTVIGAGNNGAWTLFALLLEDFVLLVPSMLGFMLCVFQLELILWCNQRLPFDLSFLLLVGGSAKDQPTVKSFPESPRELMKM